MSLYTSHCNATSNSSNGTADAFVELTAAASSRLRIKRVQVEVTTAASDDRTLIALNRSSAAGATGTVTGAGPIKVDAASRASSATATIKNGTNAFTVGTVTDVLYRGALNGRGVWIWVAASPEEEFTITGGTYFNVSITCSANSIVHNVSVTWED